MIQSRTAGRSIRGEPTSFLSRRPSSTRPWRSCRPSAVRSRTAPTAPSMSRSIEPGSNGLWQRQLDFRLPTRSMAFSTNLDISNLLNSSTATAIVTAFGPKWQRPSQVPKGRWPRSACQRISGTLHPRGTRQKEGDEHVRAKRLSRSHPGFWSRARAALC